MTPKKRKKRRAALRAKRLETLNNATTQTEEAVTIPNALTMIKDTEAVELTDTTPETPPVETNTKAETEESNTPVEAVPTLEKKTTRKKTTRKSTTSKRNTTSRRKTASKA